MTKWIWGAPAAFLVHDAEELATIEPWLRAHRPDLPAVVQPLAEMTTQQFAVGVLILFVFFVLAAAHGAHRERAGRSSLPFLLVAGALIGNAITHLLQAAYFRDYTPGLVTAAVVVLPFGIGLGSRLRKRGFVSWKSFSAFVAGGIFLQGLLIVLALSAAVAL